MGVRSSPQTSEAPNKISLSNNPLAYIFLVVFPPIILVLQQLMETFNLWTLKKALKAVSFGSVDEKKPADYSISKFESSVVRTQISKHLEHITTVKPSLSPDGRRRIVLFYSWLRATTKNIRKYTNLFTDLGIDVLIARTSMLDVLGPTSGSQVIGDEVTDFLKTHDEYGQYVVFACSIGAYVFCETMIKMREVPHLVEEVIPKFAGQLYDSAVDVKSFSVGVAVTTTDNTRLQGLIKSYLELFLKHCHESNTKHYVKAANVMYESPLGCPGAYTYSDNDPLSPEYITEGIATMWSKKGIRIHRRMFGEKSGHCTNLRSYPIEYKEYVYDFLETINVTDRESINKVLLN